MTTEITFPFLMLLITFFPTALPLEPSTDPETSGLSSNTYLKNVVFERMSSYPHGTRASVEAWAQRSNGGKETSLWTLKIQVENRKI